jgi:hypothetical protein
LDLQNLGVGRYGCTQTTTNGDICVPPVPSTVKLVTEQDTWNSLRLGLTADLLLSERLKLTGEVAYDWISQRSQDTHYFTLGGDPASGDGSGFQAEGILSYQLTDAFIIGIGGRWWHFTANSIDSAPVYD